MPDTPLLLTLYTSAGCCLCETLHEQLRGLRPELDFQLEVVDITGNPELEARYRTRIPVLLVNGRLQVKYRISTEALRQRLLAARGTRPAGILFLR